MNVDLVEAEMVDALTAGRIDAAARSEVGDRAAMRDQGSAFAVTVLDARSETGGFAAAMPRRRASLQVIRPLLLSSRRASASPLPARTGLIAHLLLDSPGVRTGT